MTKKIIEKKEVQEVEVVEIKKPEMLAICEVPLDKNVFIKQVALLGEKNNDEVLFLVIYEFGRCQELKIVSAAKAYKYLFKDSKTNTILLTMDGFFYNC